MNQPGALIATQEELLEIARKGRPYVRYAASADGEYIGAWDEALHRFVIVAAQILGGGWASCDCELCVNGVRMGHDAKWVE